MFELNQNGLFGNQPVVPPVPAKEEIVLTVLDKPIWAPVILLQRSEVLALRSISFKVPPIPKEYNHLRLIACKDGTDEWFIVKEPVTANMHSISADFEFGSYLCKWVGVHPERGERDGDITVLDIKPPAIIIPPTLPATYFTLKNTDGSQSFFDHNGRQIKISP